MSKYEIGSTLSIAALAVYYVAVLLFLMMNGTAPEHCKMYKSRLEVVLALIPFWLIFYAMYKSWRDFE